MHGNKSQTLRILDCFLTATIVITSATLVASGIAISKINTDYMSTGIKAARIVAERENTEISINLDDRLLLSPQNNYEKVDEILSLLPAPLNTGYILYKEIHNSVFDAGN